MSLIKTQKSIFHECFTLQYTCILNTQRTDLHTKNVIKSYNKCKVHLVINVRSVQFFKIFLGYINGLLAWLKKRKHF